MCTNMETETPSAVMPISQLEHASSLSTLVAVHFRIFSLDDRGRPWDAPVTIYLWSPHGDEMQRWQSKYPKMGQISLSYNLARATVSGTWTLEAVLSDQGRDAPTTKVPFQVAIQNPTNAGLFMNIHVKSSVVQAEGRVRGSIESGHVDHPQYPILGLFRLKLNVTRMRRAFHGAENSWNSVESRSLLIEGQKSKDGKILNLKPVSWKAQEIQDFQVRFFLDRVRTKLWTVQIFRCGVFK